MGDSAVCQRIQQILSERLHIDVPDTEVDLIETGAIDSLVLVDLIFHLEKEFSIVVPVETLELENFRSISAITAFIESLRAINWAATIPDTL